MTDLTPMQQALALARQGFALTEPNPRVGCVITAADGRVIGAPRPHPAGRRARTPR